MPPMMTTISALSRKSWSSPGPSATIVPPNTPPSPASAEPMKNVAAKTTWMLMPIAETIARSSTPARTIIPKRVMRNTRNMTIARPTATRRTISRNSGYESP